MKEQPYSLYGVSPTPKIFNTYAVWCVFDIILICSTLGLGVCYAIAVHLGHVHGWTDISGLVINLPERVLFRMIFALTGSLLCVIAGRSESTSAWLKTTHLRYVRPGRLWHCPHTGVSVR